MKQKFMRFGIAVCGFAIVVIATSAFGATKKASTKTSKQSAIQMGTTVRTKTEASSLYNQACYDAYYGCMDQFCIADNESGGSCSCSQEGIELNKKLEKIKDTLAEADRIKLEEVEKVEAGANADIIFSGKREYNDKGEVAKLGEQSKADKKKAMLSMWNTLDENEEDIFEEEFDAIGGKTGDDLYKAADKLCRDQMEEDCDADMTLLKQMYSRQIVSDCKGFANSLDKKESEAKVAMNEAESAVRAAYKESFESANKYDRGECMVAYKKCMMGEDACGSNWENCVFTVAAENMQNNEAKSTAKTKVKTITTYDITESTMEILESKRYICERVLDSCVAVRDNVWNDFLREAAPTIKVAESKVESQKRQSCLMDISNCIQKACKDDIVGKGTATMDSCLARPDMARSFCKVEIDPCERMEPQIWNYVVDKLAAMRVDACTQEVKDCFTDENRCGSDFSKCIGMDFDYIHDMCPVDKLVVCKKANSNFKMEDIDSMLMGLYLNIDNSVLENCQNLVEQKMAEVCGSTTDCNKFASDEIIGTSSIKPQKDGSIYRVTGMISFGSIKIGGTSGTVLDGGTKLKPGEIGVADYIENVRQKNSDVPNSVGIISSIEEELNNIAGTINRTIEMIEQDPKIQFCVSGRDLSQINGKSGSKTSARFPNLLNSVKMQIAVAALRQAQDNYNAKLTKEISEATKDASTDIAQYMCQMLPVSGGTTSLSSSTQLVPPYAISYEVGAGLTSDMLTQGGRGSGSTTATASIEDFGNKNSTKASEGIATVLSLGWNQMLESGKHVKIETPGGSKEKWAVFNRENRTCHYCTSTITKSCESKYKKGFLGIGASQTQNCQESQPVETCEDIPM